MKKRSIFKIDKLLIVLILVFAAQSVTNAQNNTDETESVRAAVQSYFETTESNLKNDTAVPSNIVHRKSKVISVANGDLSINDAYGELPKQKGKTVKLESINKILLIDTTNSSAIVKVEKIYPFGSLTKEEYESLPDDSPLKNEAGKPLKLTSYLSLLKINGDWKIVSFLISAGAETNK